MTDEAVSWRNRGHLNRGPVGNRVRLPIRMKNVFLYFLSYVVLAYVYATYSAFKWAYMGLVYDPNIFKIVFGLSALLVFSIFTPSKWSARTFYLNVMLLCYLVPSSVLFGFSNVPIASMAIVWMSFAIVYFVSAMNINSDGVGKIDARITVLFMIIFGLSLIGAIILFGGLSNFNLNLENVYVVRGEISEDLPAIFGYLVPAFTKAGLPFAIAICMHLRMRSMACVFVFISIIMFGLSSHKVMLFSPFIVVGAYLYLSRVRDYSMVLIAFVAIIFCIILSTMLIEYIGETSFFGWAESMIVWRSLIVPSYLDFGYINVFSDAPKYWWSASTITFDFLEVPYDGRLMPGLAGQYLFGIKIEANTGFIGSGFAQAGLFGVVIYSLCVGFMIALFNSFGKRLGIPFVASSTVVLFLTMVVSTDFVGLFLTHGLLALLVLLFTTPRTFVRPKLSA